MTLIAVDGFGAETATAGQTVTFVLAERLDVRGKVLARTGDVASGQVSQVSRGERLQAGEERCAATGDAPGRQRECTSAQQPGAGSCRACAI